jgi:pyruvate formate lyase activating enzyme
MDAANVDLKGFTETFYEKLCSARLQPVLDTLLYVKRHTDCWLEITNLIIPGENDSDGELHALCEWIAGNLGPDVPVHFSAFHPDWKMLDTPATPKSTLTRARRIALSCGLRYAYTGNVHDIVGDATVCHGCGTAVIGRDWYELTAWHLTDDGRCRRCGTRCAGVFAGPPGDWGRQRRPISLGAFV